MTRKTERNSNGTGYIEVMAIKKVDSWHDVSGPGIQGHDGAEIHRFHVSGGASHDLLYYNFVCLFW
jgi:hypothetical protein